MNREEREGSRSRTRRREKEREEERNERRHDNREEYRHDKRREGHTMSRKRRYIVRMTDMRRDMRGEKTAAQEET